MEEAKERRSRTMPTPADAFDAFGGSKTHSTPPARLPLIDEAVQPLASSLPTSQSQVRNLQAMAT
uniref:Uncharacterized protein n=1 Tax=Oryza sativa subsp. japonica TaxID=39947 RepID=Q67W86_ORYSJ|nr:hypothetical protein [Oryza sativa Japonica Group]BAD37583.1 hypothetical protein [Oryza sativa Japonica Group]